MKHLIILLLLFSFNAHCQELHPNNDFYYKIYQANVLAQQGFLDSAIICSEKAFEQMDYVHTHLLYRVLGFAKAANDKTRIKKYKKLIKSKVKCPEENKGILAKVDSILWWDQEYRKAKYLRPNSYYRECIKENSCDSTSKKFLKAKRINAKLTEVYASNIKAILQLIDEHGYIGEEMIGAKMEYRFQLQLLHYDYDTNNRVLEPILKEALYQGRIGPPIYSVIIDRHLFATTGKQKYWTSPFNTNNPNLSEFEMNDVLKLRESIGIYGSSFHFKQIKNGEWRVINSYQSYY